MSSDLSTQALHFSQPEEELKKLSFFQDSGEDNPSFFSTKKTFYHKQPALGSWQNQLSHEFFEFNQVKTPQIRIRNSTGNLNTKQRKLIISLDPEIELLRHEKIKQTKSKYLNFIRKKSCTSTSASTPKTSQKNILQDLQKIKLKTKRILENTTPLKKQHSLFVSEALQKKVSFISYPIASNVLKKRNYRKLDGKICPSLMLRFKN